MILNTLITFYTARVSQNDVFVVDDDKIKISIICEKRRKWIILCKIFSQGLILYAKINEHEVNRKKFNVKKNIVLMLKKYYKIRCKEMLLISWRQRTIRSSPFGNFMYARYIVLWFCKALFLFAFGYRGTSFLHRTEFRNGTSGIDYQLWSLMTSI